ncbi:2-keto-4-pentenoate hydratase [uncultured Devosia sp.]|uniref:2-keto-4-pentenoate hydratase n=1 Tax=uncultured Devosia sp. TaxID=211434 RepID=UPI0035CABA1B
MTNASAAQAALLLSRVRRTGEKLVTFPEALVPQDRAAAYAIQDEIIALEGEVGGWKIASGTEAAPISSPILARAFFASGATLNIVDLMATLVELEVGLKLGADLPPREGGYSRDEVTAAIEGLLPAFEIVGRRFAADYELPALLSIGDLQAGSAVVSGPVVTDWQGLDLATIALTLDIGSQTLSTDTGASLDSVIESIVWLANEGSLRQGGLRKGQIIITGARLKEVLGQPGETVRASLAGLGTISVTLA